MKKSIVILLAAAMVAASVPAFAVDSQHGDSHKKTMDEQCARECDLLLRDCGQEVDSIQQRIKKLQVLINEKGATTYTLEELKILNKKLKEANETLRILESPR
jgi:peptidoglycan hydrolase CwlO-like protein